MKRPGCCGDSGVGAEKVRLHLPKRVGDLGEGSHARARCVVAEIEGHRIKQIAADARKRDEHDPAAGQFDAARGEVGEEALFERSRRGRGEVFAGGWLFRAVAGVVERFGDGKEIVFAEGK